MMAVVVDHRHAAANTAKLESPIHSDKLSQSVSNLIRGRAKLQSNHRRRRRVQHAVASDPLNLKPAQVLAPEPEVEPTD